MNGRLGQQNRTTRFEHRVHRPQKPIRSGNLVQHMEEQDKIDPSGQIADAQVVPTAAPRFNPVR